MRRRCFLKGMIQTSAAVVLGCWTVIKRNHPLRVVRAAASRGYPGKLKRLSSKLTPGRWSG